jgi:hypothetical protein
MDTNERTLTMTENNKDLENNPYWPMLKRMREKAEAKAAIQKDKPFIITINEIFEKIEAGSMSVDLMGHHSDKTKKAYEEQVLEDVKRNIKHTIECFKEDAEKIRFALEVGATPLNEDGGVLSTKPHVTEVTWDTGEIIIANFFDDRKPNKEKPEKRSDYDEIFEPKDKYAEEFSLNSNLGRRNLADHYANNWNIGYGQMGNMSIDIYVNNSGTGIYVVATAIEELDTEYAEEEYGEEAVKIYKKFKDQVDISELKHQGTISLSMWRWMAADKSLLDKHKIPYEVCKDDRAYIDDEVLLTKVKSGKWKITHYYDVEGRDSYLYSKMEYIGD